ncbi:hypothetical protein CPAV1605_821 [seawater metagenome]|uniref:Uncharacterized protein n=1 Tax=seawater metagenome TaxID=1561972 RepID=A0A5E8CJ00_9ZZZZ
MENILDLKKFSDDFENYHPKIFFSSCKIRKRHNKISVVDINNIKKELYNIFPNINKPLITNNFLDINQDFQLNSKFISPKIKRLIIKSTKINLRLAFQVDNVYLFMDLYFRDVDIKEFISQLPFLIKIYTFCCKFFSKVKDLKLIFYHMNIDKVIDFDKKKIINENNVNSGLSSFSNFEENDNFIMIWRIEEFLKVYIHEIVHYLGLDFKNRYNFKNLRKMFCLNSDINISPNEAYTDFLAIIYYMIILSKGDFKKYDMYLDEQKEFVLEQAAKILNYYEYNNWDEFMNMGSCKNYFSQKTSVFSYYILKASLFFNYEQAIQELNNIKNLKAFEEYCQKVLRDEKFKSKIDKLIKKHSNTKGMSTLRMTCLKDNLLSIELKNIL